MIQLNRALAALLLAALARESAEAQPAPRFTIKTRPTAVLQFGDSTVKTGCATGTARGHCPANVANKHLLGSATVRQVGVGGASAWHLQTGRYGKYKKPFEQLITTLPEGVVAFRFGVNDTQLYSTDNFRHIMRSLVLTAQASGRKVILETPTPVWAPGLEGVAERAQVLRDLAAETGATLCDHHALAIQHGDQWEVDSGGIHRTGPGITLDGQRLAACVHSAVSSTWKRPPRSSHRGGHEQPGGETGRRLAGQLPSGSDLRRGRRQAPCEVHASGRPVPVTWRIHPAGCAA